MTRQSDLRAEAINGTKAIWSVTTYFSAFLLALPLGAVLHRLFAPLETAGTPLPVLVGVLFWQAVVVANYFMLRNNVWRSIHRLLRILNDPRVIKQHCRPSITEALRYAPLFAILLALLSFDFSTLSNLVLLGAAVYGHTWMTTHRQPRITALVNRSLGEN